PASDRPRPEGCWSHPGRSLQAPENPEYSSHTLLIFSCPLNLLFRHRNLKYNILFSQIQDSPAGITDKSLLWPAESLFPYNGRYWGNTLRTFPDAPRRTVQIRLLCRNKHRPSDSPPDP